MSKTMDRILLVVSVVSLSVSAVFTFISLFSKQKSKVFRLISMTGALLCNLCIIASTLAEPKSNKEDLA